MAWWSGTVTATNGSANVTIVSGDPIDNLVSGNALIIGNSFNPVEIKRAYFNGTNNIIELVSVWPNATQTSQPAKSFTTDADLIPIGKTLATYLSSFTKASQTDAVTGTDNTNVMTALRTKEAIQALVKSAAYLDATTSKLDHTLGRVFKMGDLGMGRTLDLRTATGGAYADYDTPQKCYNKGTLFGFIDGASLGIPNYSASAYGVLTIHGHYTDASGAMGTCQEFRYGADVWIRAYASATTWNSWTKLLKTGDYGQGSVGQMPTVPVSDLNLLNISGDFNVPPNTSNWPFGSYGGILRHSSHGNNEYSMQIASEAQNKKTKVRYRQVGGVWTAWTDFMQLGDNGFGTHLQGIKNVMAVQNPSEVLTTVNSSGSDGHYQGMIQNHGSYTPEAYGTLSGFVSLNNNYSYTWQEFIGFSSTKWRRNATSSTTWTEWRKVLEKSDFGIGGTGGAYTRCDNANALTGTGHYWTASAWVGSPTLGTDGSNQGYLIHQDWGTDSSYALQYFYNVNGGDGTFINVIRRKDAGVWGSWLSVGEFRDHRGSRVLPKFNGMAGVNANDVITPGWYVNAIDADASSNMPPLPVGGTRYWFLEVMHYTAGDATVQRAHNYTFNDGSGKAGPAYIFQRVRSGSVGWTSWQPVSTPLVGLVGHHSASGYSVGAVIERGANANGEYVKFADGTGFAWGRVIATGQTLNPAVSSNSGTAYACDPAMPLTLIDKVITLGQRAIYDSSNDLIYSLTGNGSNGYPIILNLGLKPSGVWPNLNALGTAVATKVDYYWTATGRWR